MNQQKSSDILEIPDDWRQGWLKEDPFAKLFALNGNVYRHKDGRRTLQFMHAGKSYFAKLHHGLGWQRFFKCLFRLKWPLGGAENEWQAIQILEKLNLPTTPLVAYGQRGNNPLTRQSFIITKDLANTESLEDYCRDWPVKPPNPFLKRALIQRVAEITGTLHREGLNHCDLYICHFLLDLKHGKDPEPENLTLHLIDLHRVRQRKKLPRRWQVKDLAALHFSSLEIGLTLRDRLRFIATYTQRPWRRALKEQKQLWLQVEKRAQAFYREYKRRGPR
ncbi:MAG: lipopolysaccharide core heptose(I) kinase RfaP [Deltaproteobacteria bacterium]|nr:lipopolysaccharide core heptose(I) kinase RfaP [Deltaproteobacteria bacterium]